MVRGQTEGEGYSDYIVSEARYYPAEGNPCPEPGHGTRDILRLRYKSGLIVFCCQVCKIEVGRSHMDESKR